MRTIKPLSVKQIDNAKPTAKPYRLYDGNGLSILISHTSKIWHFNYHRPITKKRTMMSLGAYPTVSLAMARAKRDEYLTLLSQGIDPQKHLKEQAKQALEQANNTFSAVASQWLDKQLYATTTIRKTKKRLQDINERLGFMPIADITGRDIISTCQAIEKAHTPLMASKAKTTINQILDYAVSHQMVEYNVARPIKQIVTPHVGGHHSALTEPKEFAQFVKYAHNLSGQQYKMGRFISLLIYVFVRPGELANMKVSDIDWENKQWRYTPPKTKRKGTELVVPLSDQALAIIKDCISRHEQDYVFMHNCKEQSTINVRYTTVMGKKWKGKQTLHGIRASAKTILEEVLEYDPRYIEMQLGHTVKDMNGTAYNRAKYIKQRTQMMQAWADYVDSLVEKS